MVVVLLGKCGDLGGSGVTPFWDAAGRALGDVPSSNAMLAA